MPPSVKVTREQIIEAAFELIRSSGAQALNARAVAQQLGSSTQPVMYNFATVEQLRQAVYQRADAYHSAFLMQPGEGNPLLNIGLNYVRFGHQEPHLFRFLFQSNQFSEQNLDALIASPELTPIIEMVAAAGIPKEEATSMFRRVFIMAHGYASLLANNAMVYDEEACTRDLLFLFHNK